jgi:hypothetical protein
MAVAASRAATGSRPGQKVKTKYFRAVSCFEQICFRSVPYAIGVRANLKR